MTAPDPSPSDATDSPNTDERLGAEDITYMDSAVSFWQRLPLPALHVAAFWLCISQTDVLLHQLQSPGESSYGFASLGGGLSPDVNGAQAALKVTQDKRPAFPLLKRFFLLFRLY